MNCGIGEDLISCVGGVHYSCRYFIFLSTWRPFVSKSFGATTGIV